MTLKKKILIGYGVVFVLMGLVVVWAVTNLVSLGKASDAILRENYRSILAAENMVDTLERQDSAVLLILLGDAEKGIHQFRENESMFLQWLARAKDNITIQGEGELVQSIEANYAKYRREFSALTDLRDAAKPPLQVPYYQEAIFPLFAEVRDSCIRLRNLNEETMYAASLKAGSVANRAIWSTVFVATSALIVALVFSLLLAERIVRPLRRFMEASRKISGGDYAVQVPVETDDELGRLAGEFNQMASQLGQYQEARRSLPAPGTVATGSKLPDSEAASTVKNALLYSLSVAHSIFTTSSMHEALKSASPIGSTGVGGVQPLLKYSVAAPVPTG